MAIPFLSDIRLPSSGKVYLWTGHNSNFLQYNLWHASASGGMFIKNISSSGDIYFQTNSTTALTLDSSQNATFAGDVTVTGGDITLGTDSIASNINAVGDVLAFKVDSNENTGGTPNIQFKVGSATELTINGSSATFAGDIYTKNLKLGNGSTDSSIQLDGDFGGGDLTIQNLGNNKDILFKGNDDGTAITALTLDMSLAGEAKFNSNIRVPGEINLAGSTTYSIDLKDHSNYTWLRNEPGQWSFQSGTSGDDWTQSWQIYVPNVGSDGGNATFVELGQRHTNDTTGEFKGVKIVKRTGAGVVDGDFHAGESTFTGGVTFSGASHNVSVTSGTNIRGSNHLFLQGDASYVQIKSPNNYIYYDAVAHNFRKEDGTAAYLVINATNATFSGDIHVGANYIGRDGDNYIGFVTDNLIKFRVNGATQVKLSDGVFAPQTDSDIDLGSNGTRFANVYADTLHGTVAEANNLQSFDDRDMAPEDMSFSDDLKLFFVEKTGIEGGTVGSNWQDALFISSYVDASGGNPNLLAFDKSEKKIYHYQASATATSWGTPKELAYTSDFVKRTGGSSTSMSGDLHIIAGGPRIYLQDNTDDDDQQIVFRNSSGVDDYKITTQDFTGAGAGDGMFIGSENADQVALVTNDTIALTIDTSQNATFAGSITGKDNGIIIDSLSGPYGRIHGTSSIFLGGGSTTQVQLSGNIMPDGNNSRSLGTSSRYWSETFTSGVTSGGNIVINSNTPVLTLGVINSSTGNAKIQLYSKNSGTSNGYALQYNKDTGIDRLEFIDGSGAANIKFNNGGAAEFAGSVTATQIDTGQGATEVHLMNQNLRTTDDVTFDDLTVTGNFTVTGTVNTVSSTNLVVQDKTITVGKNQTESASGGSGLIVDGSNASILWDETNNTWDFNKGIDVDGNINVGTQATDILIGDNLGAALEVKEGSNLYMRFNTTNGGEKIEINKPVEATFINASTGFRMASGQAIDFVSTNIGYNSIERNTTVGGLQINTGDSASVNILDDGKVGIGTTTPDRRLEVENTSGVGEMALSGTTGARLYFRPTTAYTAGGNFGIIVAGTSSAPYLSTMDFTGYNNGVNTIMTMKGDGKVGIGTVSPYYILDTRFTNTDTSFSGGGSGNWGSNGIRIENTSSTANTMAAIHLRNSDADIHIAGIRQGTDDSDLGFFFESSEKVRFTKDGNVGIGTASPDAKVDIHVGSSSLAMRFQKDGQETYRLNHGTSGLYFTKPDSNGLAFGVTQNSDFQTFDSSGNVLLAADASTERVGIGTGGPDTTLHVVTTEITGATPTTFGHVMIEDTDAQIDLVSTQSGTWGSAINFKEHNTSDSNTNDIWSIARKTTGGAGDSSLNFNFGTSNQHDNANKVNFSSTGKITTAGGVNYTGGTIATATTVLHTNNIVYNIGGSNGIILSNADYSDRYYITNSDHRWEVASADAMRLNSTGLGIGTTSPAYKLDVAGDIKCTTSLKIDAGSPFLGLYNSGTEKAYLQWSQSNDYLTLQSDGDTRFITVGTERIRIKSDGKVGIGTTGPTYKLSVPSGGIEAGGKITYSKSAGSLNATGYAVAGITAAANGNGSSCGFVFTCFGHVGAYQRIVYSCYNGSGTWYAKKVIDEGTNQLDVVASANGSTITFTFKATDSTMSYTPRVTVEATGHNINSTYA